MYTTGDTITALKTFTDSTGALTAATIGTCGLIVGGVLDGGAVAVSTPFTDEYEFSVTVAGAYSGVKTALIRVPYTVAGVSAVTYLPVGEVGGELAAIKTQTDKLTNLEAVGSDGLVPAKVPQLDVASGIVSDTQMALTTSVVTVPVNNVDGAWQLYGQYNNAPYWNNGNATFMFYDSVHGWIIDETLGTVQDSDPIYKTDNPGYFPNGYWIDSFGNIWSTNIAPTVDPLTYMFPSFGQISGTIPQTGGLLLSGQYLEYTWDTQKFSFTQPAFEPPASDAAWIAMSNALGATYKNMSAAIASAALATAAGQTTILHAVNAVPNATANQASAAAALAASLEDSNGLGKLATEANATANRTTITGAISTATAAILAAIAAIPTSAAAIGSAVWTYATRVLTSVTGLNVVITNPVAANNNLTVVKGDAYDATTNQAITFSDNGTWPVMTSGGTQLAGVEVKLTIATASSLAPVTSCLCTVTGTAPNQQIAPALTGAITGALTPGGQYVYDIRASLNHTASPPDTEVRSLVSGQFTVNAPVTTTW